MTVPIEIRVPRLGWSMERGVFFGWLKKDGDVVRLGDPLFEIEGDKAVQEVESTAAGILRVAANGPKAGAEIAVGALLGHLTGADEPAPEIEPSTPSPTTSAPPKPAEAKSGALPPAAPPSVRRLARQAGVSIQSVVGSGPAGRISVADVRAVAGASKASAEVAPATSRGKSASPRARRVAASLGVDWNDASGTGRGGRVREADVRRLASASPADGAGVEVLSPTRRTIAERMHASARQTAAVTLTKRVDASNLVNLRRQFQARGEGAIVPSYTDFVVKLAAAVLHAHRRMAAVWDTSRERLILPAGDALDVGVAVDAERGLVVPVVRGVLRSSILELAAQSRDLVERARAGRLAPDAMIGGVFTVTNLGAFGVDGFTPIINDPQTAILGMGAITREPIVLDDDRLGVGVRMTMSLTFDHRAHDGGPAARFLQDLGHAIENPAGWLL